MNIYLSKDIIRNLDYSDTEIAVYVALKSLHISTRDTQVITLQMIAYELFGSKNYTRNTFNNIKSAFFSLVNKGLVTVKEELSKTEFAVDMSKLYFNYKEDNTFYVIIRDNEIHKIFSFNNKMDKFKLLRYYLACLYTIDAAKRIYIDAAEITNFVGYMSQYYLCKEIGVNYDTNVKLIEQYNSILEENHLLYIFRHTKLRRDRVTGQFKSFNNNYGRYEDKEKIAAFAIQYENAFDFDDQVVKNSEANKKRSLAAKFNNLRMDFNRYSAEYTEEELIEIYEYIHNKNELDRKELRKDGISGIYKDDLISKLRCRDERIFDKIPCVVRHTKGKSNLAAENDGLSGVVLDDDYYEKSWEMYLKGDILSA